MCLIKDPAGSSVIKNGNKEEGKCKDCSQFNTLSSSKNGNEIKVCNAAIKFFVKECTDISLW
jgi:hypothetical protein